MYCRRKVFVLVPEDRQILVIEAASRVFAVDMLPLSIFETHKDGMIKFSKSLVELGKFYSNAAQINVRILLSSANNVCKGFWDVIYFMMNEFKVFLPKLLVQGSRVTYNAAKLQANSQKYYHFVINYILSMGVDPLRKEGVCHGKFVKYFFLHVLRVDPKKRIPLEKILNRILNVLVVAC